MCVCVSQDIESEGPEPSDWDKYASEEYEILVAVVDVTVLSSTHTGAEQL